MLRKKAPARKIGILRLSERLNTSPYNVFLEYSKLKIAVSVPGQQQR